MPNLLERLYERLTSENVAEQLATDYNTQFGRTAIAGQELVGARLLPERLERRDMFREVLAKQKGFVANDNSAFSPPQIKQSGFSVGSFLAELGNIDIASQFTADDIEAIIHLAQYDDNIVFARMVDWLNESVNMAIRKKSEIQRWQAIVNGAVQIVGMDGRRYTLLYPNLPGQRRNITGGTVAAPAGWYSPTYDPFLDLIAVRNFFSSQGRIIREIWGDADIVDAMINNAQVRSRLATSLTIVGSELRTVETFVTDEAINAYMRNQLGMPGIQKYDTVYETQTGSGFFKARGALVFVATTDLREIYYDERGAEQMIINNTLGYYARGRAAGEVNPGIVIRTKFRDIKPQSVYAEGVTKGLPILQDPSAVAVLNIQKPTP